MLTGVVTFVFDRMSLADGQSLAIRKLLSQASSESSVAPGPPLPKSHPSPVLLAKLHLECASLYSSARSLIKNLEASKSDVHGDVSSDLRRYLAEEAAFHGALSKKWLGVDAGENGGANKGGEAVAFMAWAKKELLEVKDSSNGINRGKIDKEQKTDLKNRVALELNSITLFHKHYQKMNDTVCLCPKNSVLLSDCSLGTFPARSQSSRHSKRHSCRKIGYRSSAIRSSYPSLRPGLFNERTGKYIPP